MRRAPCPAVGGSTTVASPVSRSIRAMWLPASDAYQTSPEGVAVIPYGPRPRARRTPRPGPPGVEPAVHARLAGEPEHAVAVERGGIEVRVRMGSQLEHLDLLGRGVHPHDRVQAAIRDPRRAVGTDDHAVRRGARAEIDLADLPGLPGRGGRACRCAGPCTRRHRRRPARRRADGCPPGPGTRRAPTPRRPRRSRRGRDRSRRARGRGADDALRTRRSSRASSTGSCRRSLRRSRTAPRPQRSRRVSFTLPPPAAREGGRRRRQPARAARPATLPATSRSRAAPRLGRQRVLEADPPRQRARELGRLVRPPAPPRRTSPRRPRCSRGRADRAPVAGLDRSPWRPGSRVERHPSQLQRSGGLALGKIVSNSGGIRVGEPRSSSRTQSIRTTATSSRPARTSTRGGTRRGGSRRRGRAEEVHAVGNGPQDLDLGGPDQPGQAAGGVPRGRSRAPRNAVQRGPACSAAGRRAQAAVRSRLVEADAVDGLETGARPAASVMGAARPVASRGRPGSRS